ncbi:omlA [Symbiodinium sp. KB8]|nr:omlA [Symbiodinium sp. KB8]
MSETGDIVAEQAAEDLEAFDGQWELQIRFAALRPRTAQLQEPLEEKPCCSEGQPCGAWFLDLAVEGVEGLHGFPHIAGCKWNESVPQISLQLSGEFPTCRGDGCSFHLALNVEVTEAFQDASEVAQIAAVCRGTENCSMYEGVEVLSLPVFSTRGTRSSLSPGSLILEDLPRHQRALLLEDDSELHVNLSLSLQLPPEGLDLQPIVNVSSILIRMLLFPLSSWEVATCEASIGICETEHFGPYRSWVSLDMSAAWDVGEGAAGTWHPGSDWRSWQLALPAPRTAFFPSQVVAELMVSGEDENASLVEFSGILPFAAFWRRQSPGAPAIPVLQLLVIGRSGHGPFPFPSKRNEILVRLELPTTLTAGTRGGAGLSLHLPEDYECLSAETILQLQVFDAPQDAQLLESLEVSRDVEDFLGSVTHDTGRRWWQRGTRPSECFLNLEEFEAFYAGQQIYVKVAFHTPGSVRPAEPWHLELRSRGEDWEASTPDALSFPSSGSDGSVWQGGMSVLGDLHSVTLQPSTLSFSAVPWFALALLVLLLFGHRKQAAFWLTVTLQPHRHFAAAVIIDGPKSVDFQTCAARVNEALCGSMHPASLSQPPASVEARAEGVRPLSLAVFNPDHGEPSWELSVEDLQVNISLSDRRPFLLSGATAKVEVDFLSPRSGRTDLRIIAPSGYIWGPPVTAGVLPRDCWAALAMPSGWPGCEVANVVTWDGIDLVANETYILQLEVRVPAEMPRLGSNAFFVQLGAFLPSSSSEAPWAGAVLSKDAMGEPFLILAISEAGLTFSASCAIRAPLATDMPRGAIAVPDGTDCQYRTTEMTLLAPWNIEQCRTGGRRGGGGWSSPSSCKDSGGVVRSLDAPLLLLSASMPWPGAFYAVEVLGRNPPSPGPAGTWTFQVFDSATQLQALFLAASAVGCPVRRALSAGLLAAPEPYSEQATAWEITGRPGQRDHVVLSLSVTERPAVESGFLPLRLVAPKGWSFVSPTTGSFDVDGDCSAYPAYPDPSSKTLWPGPFGACRGHGREAVIEVPAGLEPLNVYSLRVAVINPRYEELSLEAEEASVWFLELGDEASPPLLGPRLRLLRDIRVEPTSTAAQGRKAPLLLSLVPSTSVPSHGRLRITAPQGIAFEPGSCLLVESAGACEQCSAVVEALDDLAAAATKAGGWCASTSECSDEAGDCPEAYFSFAVALSTAQQSESISVAASCSFRLLPEDVHCETEDAETGQSLVLQLSRMQFVFGRRYEVSVDIRHPSVDVAENLSDPWEAWQLQTETLVDDLWQPVDVGEAPSYALSPALGLSVELQLEPPKRLRNGSLCQPPVAGGSTGVVHVLLDLALPLLQGDELYIWLPRDQLISSCQLSDSSPPSDPSASQASLCGDPAELEIDWEGRESTGGTVPPVEVDPNAATALMAACAVVASFSMLVAPTWAVRPLLNAAVRLTAGQAPPELASGSMKAWPSQSAGSDSVLTLELNPRLSASHLRLVAVSPPDFDFFGTESSPGLVLEAFGPRLLLLLALQPWSRREIWLGPVRLGRGGGPTTFHLATMFGEGAYDIMEEVLGLRGFRLPGSIVCHEATLWRQLLPSENPLIASLPARLGEAAWLSLTFSSGQPAKAMARLTLSSPRTWELQATGASLAEVAAGEVLHTVPLANATSFTTSSLSMTLVEELLARPRTYSLTVWALSFSYEEPPGGFWLLDVFDATPLPVATSDLGFSLPLRGAWPLPALSLQLSMGSPPPGGRTFARLLLKPWLLSAWLLVLPPPGWLLSDASPGPEGRSMASLGFQDLSAGWEVELQVAASLETTTDTAWFVLATDGEVGEDLAAQSWGYVDGANVAPMWGSVKHANLAGLNLTGLVFTMRLDQESQVGIIRVTPPEGYGQPTCEDAADVRGAPRWPMSLRRFGPYCQQAANESHTEVLLTQPLPVGSWAFALAITLPDAAEDPRFRVEVFTADRGLVDAATSLAAPDLLSAGLWPLTAPSLILRSRNAASTRLVLETSFRFDQMMPVATGSIEALRLLPPSGVQYDEEFSLTVEGLPLARGSPTVTSSQAFVTLLAASTVTPGDVSIRCGVKLTGEPAENVWMLDICRQLTCSSAEALRFPLLGPSENEEPIPDVEVGCCQQRVLARLAAAFTLTLLGLSEQGLDAALLMMSAMPFKLARDVKTFDVDLRMPSVAIVEARSASPFSVKIAKSKGKGFFLGAEHGKRQDPVAPLKELSVFQASSTGFHLTGMRTLSADAKSKVEELFDKMDKDTSGTITKEEAHKFFSSFAKVNAKAMFDEVDDDGNGSITKAEWVGFWNQVRAAGYSNDQILEELELMTDGGDWVNWKDGKDVAAMSRDKSDFAKSTEPVKVPEAVPEASQEAAPEAASADAQEEPKAEEPKAEEPKAEEPKAEEPKAEEPKAEEPKAEEPKAEEPKAEEPKAEEAQAEAAAPLPMAF